MTYVIAGIKSQIQREAGLEAVIAIRSGANPLQHKSELGYDSWVEAEDELGFLA
jgi:hypothetical protein